MKCASTLWVQIEQSQTHILLKGTLWCYDDLPSGLKAHPLIGTTLRHSHLITSQKSLAFKTSPLFPILVHLNFEPGLHPAEYPTLRSSDCDHAAKFVINRKWPSILELTEATGNFQLPFWKAAQLHHFLHSIPDPQDFTRQLTTFEDLCLGIDPLAHILSQTYSLLNTPKEKPQLPCLTRWEKDLNCMFSAVQKQCIITLALKTSLCIKTQETNFKLLPRWYLTPSRLHKCFPSASNHCWRCGEEEGTLLHIFWSCPRLKDFWGEVRRITQEFTECNIPEDAALFLLHHSKIPTKTYKKSLIRNLLNAAKACIPLYWKQQSPPDHSTLAEKSGESKENGGFNPRCTKQTRSFHEVLEYLECLYLF